MGSELQTMNGQNKLALWAEHVSVCRSSDQSVRDWCKTNGICEQTFYRWQKKLYGLLSSKNEVIDAIKENAAQILDSLSGEKENTGFRKIISSIKMCDAYNASLFHYLNKKMSKIYGRDEQLNRLCAFLDNDLNFSFCVISGPGGIGKSKLAHSFIQRQNRNQTGWKMFFVNEDTLDQMATCDDWNHDSNTLLVVDYAGIEPALLHRCFVNVANYEKKFEKKLRIILLDRIGS